MRLITLAAAVVLTITATPATAAPAAPRIATHNVFMLSRNLYPNWGQLARADLLDSTGVLEGQDVVVLNEAFDNAASDRLLANLRDTYPHQTPVLGRTRGTARTTASAATSTAPSTPPSTSTTY